MTSNEDPTPTPQGDDEHYDLWLRERIRKAREDPRPSVPHHEVMVRLQAKILCLTPSSASHKK